MLSWMMFVAFAGEVEIERSIDLLAEGRPNAAYEMARGETEGSVDARLWLTFFASCDAVGLGPACRAEVAVRGDEHPELELFRQWYDRRHHDLKVDIVGGPLEEAASGRLEGLTSPAATLERMEGLVLQHPDAAVEVAMEWMEAHPEHPEVLLPLFGSEVPPRVSLGRARKSIEKSSKKQLKRVSDPAVALRWHRLLKRMKSEQRAAWSAKVVELGAPAPTPDLPLSRAQQVKEANAILMGKGSLPEHIRADREAVALKASAMFVSAGRASAGADILKEALDGSANINLSLALAEVLLADGRSDDALVAAETAVSAAIAPWPTDRIGADRIGRRIALGKALAIRGEARSTLGSLEDALVDLMIANQLTFEPERAGVLEKAMKQGRYSIEALKASLETPATPAQEIALEKAVKALEAGQNPEAITAATSAIRVLCLPTHRRARLSATLPARPQLASAFALRALAEIRSGDTDAARADLFTAILLEPWSAHADWWAELAALQGPEFGLLAEAMTQRTSEEPVDIRPNSVTGLEPTQPVQSAISAALVSTWMKGSEAREENPNRIKVTRGKIFAYHVRSSGAGTGKGRGRAPVLNQPFPSFSLQTPTGRIVLGKGRINLVSFYRSDSPSSMRALTDLALLARKMRGRGLDVMLVGVSMDEEESVFARTAAERSQLGTLAWAPDLGERFGVDAVPTTWIVDAQGIARFVHVGYLGPSVYEDGIRYVSAR